jgi:Tfp pilus assembly protein PilZ
MSTREFVRHDAELKVRIETGEFVGATKDLSRGGMLIRSKREFTKGANLQLIISLPDGEAEAVVQICWIRFSRANGIYGIGVKFLQLSPEMMAYVESIELPSGMATVAVEI